MLLLAGSASAVPITSWQSLPDLPEPLDSSALAWIDGRVYCVGGRKMESEWVWICPTNPTMIESSLQFVRSSVWVLDPAAGSWNPRAGMAVVRYGFGAGTIDGVEYVAGGCVSPSKIEEALEAYHPATDTWTRRAPMPIPLAESGAAVLDGKLYVIGGTSGGLDVTNTAERYDPATDTWEVLPAMPTARRRLAVVACRGRIWAVGGTQEGIFGIQTGAPPLVTVEIFDPATNIWSAGPPLPSPRAGMAAVETCDGFVVIGGAESASAPHPGGGILYLPPGTRVDSFDATTSTWSALTPLAQPRKFAGAVRVANQIVLAGGEGAGSSNSVKTVRVGRQCACPATGALEASVSRQEVIGVSAIDVRYAVRVTNRTVLPLHQVSVVDTVPAPIGGLSIDQPPGLAAPTVVSTGAGTRLSWNATGVSLPGGRSWTFTISGSLPFPCQAQTLAASAAATAAFPGCGAPVRAEASDAWAILPLSVGTAVAGGPYTARPGDPVAWRIVVVNRGISPLTELRVVDTVSAAVTGLAATGPAGMPAPVLTTVAGGTRVAWDGTGLNLPAGIPLTFTITGWAAPVCAPANASGPTGIWARTTCERAMVLAAPPPIQVVPRELGVAVSAFQVPPLPRVGDRFSRMVVLANTGTAPWTEVSVTDTLPAFISISGVDQPPEWGTPPALTPVVGGHRVDWFATGLAIPPGAAVTVTVTGTVTSVCSMSPLECRPVGTVGNACGNRSASGAGPSVAVAPPVGALTVTMPAPVLDTPAAGPVRFTIVIRNTGSATLEGLAVRDTMPPGVTVTGTEAPGWLGASVLSPAGAGTVCAWNAAAAGFAPGQAVTVTITGTVSPVCSPALLASAASAEGRWACGTVVTAPAQASCPLAADRRLSASLVIESAGGAPGDPVTLTFKVTNTGVKPFSSLLLVETLPPQLRLGSLHGEGVVPGSHPGRVVTWTRSAPLDAGATVTARVTASLECPVGTLLAEAGVQGVDGCAAPVRATAAAAQPLPGLGVTLVRSPANPVPGGPVRYLITLTNHGTVALSSLEVVDTLPGLFMYERQTGPPLLTHTRSGAVHAWTCPPLDPGASTVITIDGELACGAGWMVNRASVTPAPACGVMPSIHLSDQWMATCTDATPLFTLTVEPATRNAPVNTPVRITATVRNLVGVPVAGRTVNFRALAGTGSVSPASGMTDAQGCVRTVLLLGREGGANAIDASTVRAPPVTVTVTGEGLSPELGLAGPGAALDRNVFSPSRGEELLVRVRVKDGFVPTARVLTPTGRVVQSLRPVSAGAGMYTFVWDGRTSEGDLVGRGVFLVHVRDGGFDPATLKVVGR